MTATLSNILKIAEENNLTDVLEYAEALNRYENSGDKIPVVVLGRFKAGKSSFINNLTGENLLPTGVIPVTSVITLVNFGVEKERIIVTFKDGAKKEIASGQLSNYISEKENPDNVKKVDTVEINLRSSELPSNLILVDTPGTGSVFKHNSEVTRNWLKNTGAAIVLINASQPLSENDIELLKETVKQSPEIYLVLSKADLLKSSELSEITSFIKDKCKNILGREFPVFPFSIYEDNEIRKKRIIENIFEKISKKAHDTNKKVVEHKINYLKDLTVSYLKISLNIYNKKDEERKQLYNRIVDRRLKLDFVKKELYFITRDYSESVRGVLEKTVLKKYKSKLIKELSSELEIKYETWNGNLSKVTRNYEKWIKTKMAESMLKIDKAEHDEMQNYLNEVSTHLTEYLKGFRERIDVNMKKVLGVTLPDEKIEVEVEFMKKANISVSWAFESHIDMLWFLIPMPLLRNRFKKYFLKQIPYEVDKNLHRFVSLRTLDIQREVEKLYNRSLDYVTSQLTRIQNILEMELPELEKLKKQLEMLDGY